MLAGFRSPFRFDSHEPRFAIEDHDLASLEHALALWKKMTFRSGPVTHAASYPNALLLSNSAHPGPIHPWEPLSLAWDGIVPQVARWLETASVDMPQPNFDGSEVKGFSAFWGYFRNQELGHSYGCLVITTKWFEIHK